MLTALGLIEAVGLPATIAAADAAVKAANVTLLGAEVAKGGGRITIKLVGNVSAVTAAVAAGAAAAALVGRVIGVLVIARPHQQLEPWINSTRRDSEVPGAAERSPPAAIAASPERPGTAPRGSEPAIQPPVPEAGALAVIEPNAAGLEPYNAEAASLPPEAETTEMTHHDSGLRNNIEPAQSPAVADLAADRAGAEEFLHAAPPHASQREFLKTQP
jgi:microcompartment protein CcmL/EutN